mmetsp:Transcript_35540/g.111192  ORF Transcript_35540/g.111192 Transcript_35540/m.111192 type:complete len:110 (+) Transcript_35540:1253-1582(+)
MQIEVFNKEQGMVPTSILSMSWNRSGERLAITLAGTRDNPEQKHHLGLYLTECDGRSNHVRLVIQSHGLARALLTFFLRFSADSSRARRSFNAMSLRTSQGNWMIRCRR